MDLTPSTATVRGSAARSRIALPLQALVAAVEAAPRAPGVEGYAIGEGPRDRATQLLHLARGTTRAGWMESAHNWVDPDGLAQAVDLYPLVRGDDGALVVSNVPAHYQPIADEATARGLVTGSTWSDPDWPHVEIPGWRSRRPPSWAESLAPAAGSSAVLLLLALLLWRLL